MSPPVCSAIPLGLIRPVVPPLIVALGATLPLLPPEYTNTLAAAESATKMSPLVESTAMPSGLIKPVLPPLMVALGDSLSIPVLLPRAGYTFTLGGPLLLLQLGQFVP